MIKIFSTYIRVWFILLLCVANYFPSAFSQTGYPYDPYERNMRLGLVLQPNLSWLNYDGYANSEPAISFGYGLMADLGFARNYYFSTGLLINSLNSTSIVDPQTGLSARRDIRLKYAEVPLTIKLKTEERNYGRVYGQFGLTAGVRVSAKEQTDKQQQRVSVRNADLFRLGLQIGTGVEWNLGANLGLLTGLSYNNGFTRAINEQGAPKSSFVAFNFGLLF